jgi:hypothetical protein
LPPPIDRAIPLQADTAPARPAEAMARKALRLVLPSTRVILARAYALTRR